MNKIIVRFVVVLALLVPMAASAAVPITLNYQGFLTDSNGTPVNGTTNITFNLYIAMNAMVPSWTETLPVNVANGVYSVVLGSTPGNPISPSLFAGEPAFSIAVEGETMTRQKLTSVAFSIRAASAERADSVSDGGVTNTMITGPISATKIEQGSGSTLDADTVDTKHAADLQSRVTGTCGPGSSVGAVNANGSVVCVATGLTGTLTSSYLPRSDGAGLVDSSIFDNGSVGIGISTPAAKLDVLASPLNTYGSWLPYSAYYNPCRHCVDTCDGNHQTEFSCSSGQLTCEDIRNSDGEDWEYRSVICNQVQTAAQFSGDVRVTGGVLIGDGSGLTNLNVPLCLSGDFLNCYEGPAGTLNVGLCTAGSRTCSGGAFGACVGQTLPGVEICNNQIDEDCNGVVDDAALEGAPGCTWFYADADQDGFGHFTSGKCMCHSTTEYPVSNHSDCFDLRADVHPGVTAYHTTPFANDDYDYNCNYSIERKYTTYSPDIQSCYAGPSECEGSGWRQLPMPACGETADWLDCSTAYYPACGFNTTLTTNTQACR